MPTDVRDARIAEIKRIWKPGMSVRQILDAINLKAFKCAKRPSRSVIIGLFHRNAERLLPCELLSANGNANNDYQARRIRDKKERLRVVKEKPVVDKRRKREVEKVQKVVAEPLVRTPEERVRRFQLDQQMLDREPVFQAQQKTNKARITLVSLSFMK